MPYAKMNKLHIVAVVAVIRNSDGKYLVLKRRDDEVAYPGMFTFPGGKIEGNDTVEETLIKEVLEETGLVLKKGKCLLKDKSFIRPDGQTTKVFSFLCGIDGPAAIKLSGDFTDYKWVSLIDLPNIPHVGIEGELKKAERLEKQRFSLADLSTDSIKESSNVGK